VDGEVFLYVKGAEVSHLIVSGQALRVERSTYSQPIPEAEFGIFELDKVDGRGRADLFEAPHRDNDYTAIIRVNDDRGGNDLYHLRLNWTWNPDNPNRPPRVREVRRDDFPGFEFPDFSGSRSGELDFRGRVDQVTAVTIRGDRVGTEDFAGRRLRDGEFNLSGRLPSVPVDIELEDVRGRGQVELVEVPWEGNGYTAVVRIEDAAGGAADYRFTLVWRRR
jgi:hypothetical protein